MADTQASTVELPEVRHVRGSYVPVKEGHPRFNVAILLLLLAAFLVFALVEAQRLQL